MVARARAASRRSKALASFTAVLIAATAALVYVELARAATTVTAGSATATADQANAGTFVTVSTITVSEGVNTDWGKNGGWGATDVTIQTPTGWEYDTATAPTLTQTQGSNLTGLSSSYSNATSLTISLVGSGRNGTNDAFTITNLKVRPTSTNPLYSGAVVATSATQMVGAIGLTFANLTETAGAPARLALTGASSSTAGVNSGSITATITDAYGNTTTRGSNTIVTPSSSSTSGSKVFKTTGGTVQTTFTITAGTSTVSFLSYDETAGSYSLTLANDSSLMNPAAYPFTVNAAAATRIALAGPGSATAGQNSTGFTATLEDQFGNAATRGSATVVTPASSSTSGSKAFKTTGGTPQATFTISAGSSAVSFLYYDETAGSYNATLTNDGGLTNPAAHAVTVTAAAASALTLSGASSSTAGVNSGSLTATLVDAFGNTATRGSSTVITPSSSSTSGSRAFKTTGETPQASFTIAAASSTVSFLYYDEAAGSYSISLTNDGSLANPAGHPFTVTAAAATALTLSGPASVTAGVDSTTLTATLHDTFGNTATRGSNTVITPASSSASASKVFKTTGGTPQATYTITAGTSTVQFRYYDETAGSYNITLTNDSALTDPAAHGITVDAAAATKIALSGPASATAGQDSSLFTATVQDAFDNAATRGSDTVITPASSSSSGTKAFKTAGGTPQATYTITAGTSTVQFGYYDETAGSYNVTLTNDSSLTNPGAHAISVAPGAFTKLQLLLPGETAAPGTASGKTGTLDAQTADEPFTVTVNAVDAHWNVVGSVSDTVSITSSDAQAILPSDAALSAGTRNFSVTLKTGGSQTITSSDVTDPGKSPSTSPSTTVYAAHGSGTLTSNVDAVSASQSGRTIVFTYTAATGGMNDGAVRVTVPGGWSAPSTTASAAGFTTASAGTVGVSGQVITVTGVTLAGGATLTITYGAAPGPGATATSSTGAQSWQAAQRSTAAGTVTNLAGSPSITVYAADGSGTLSVSPTSVFAGSTGHQLTFTYTAAAGGMSDGAVSVVVPADWTDPTGITSASLGSVSISGSGPWTVTVIGLTLGGGATLTITYGNGSTVTAPATPATETFTTEQRSLAGSTLTAVAAQPTVEVEAIDGAGTMAVAPSAVSAARSPQTLTFTYTAGPAAMTNGAITVEVPAGWTAPAGITTASTGTVGTAGQLITVTDVTLAAAATMTITYGPVTVPSSPGTSSWPAEQRGTSGGTLTPLVTSPSTTIYAADGTGSIVSDTSYVVNGSLNNTIEFTYTAAALGGGMSNGTVEIAVPGNWSAPNPVDITASTGTVGVSGNTITVTGVTLAQGAAMTITLANAEAPATGGAQAWTTRQASTAAGALTGIASPSIVVSSAPDVAALASPAGGATVTPTPTLTATFTDADAANTGTLTFQVCSDGACTSVVHQLTSGSVANGANGSVVVPALTEGATYHWRALATDSDGLSSAYSATRSFAVDGTGPTVDSVVVTESDAASHASADTFFYRPGAVGGTFTVTVDASDPAGLDHVTFPDLAGGTVDVTTPPYARTYAWDGTFADSGPKTVTAVDALDNSTSDTFTITPDSAAPTGGTISVPQFSSSQTITITSASYTDAGSGIASNAITRAEAPLTGPGVCGSFTGATVVSSPDAVDDANCYRYTLTGTDNVGNTATTSATVLVDTTAPSTPTLTLSESAGNLHADGTTLWFRGGAGSGTFTVGATTSDAQSGIDKVAFPAVGSVGAADDATLPYEATYAWTGAEELGNAVVSHNEAGLTAATTFDVREDATAPSGGSISVPAYSSTLGLSITTTSFTDGGSGIASNVITRSDPQDPSTPGTCPAGGWTGATVVAGPSDTVPSTGKCYRYTLTGTDNVGNAETASAVVLVDTTPPAAPALTLSETETNLHASGTTLWFRSGAGSGTFTLLATTSDDQSGIDKVAFPAVGSVGAADDASFLYERTYAWSGSQELGNDVVAHNKSGLTAMTEFDVRQDGGAPTGGSLTVPAYAGSTSVTISTTNFTDGESGIASNVITRSDGQDPTSPGVCPAGGYTGATVVTSPDVVPSDAKCYRYTLTGTDNVGNTASATATALVDTTPPTGPGLTVATSSAGVYADDTTKTVWFQPSTATGSFTVTASTSDGQSDIDKVSFPAIVGLTGGGDVTPPGPFPMSYSWSAAPASSADNAVTAFNKAGATAANTFDLGSDGGDPTGGGVSYPNGAQSDSAPDVTVTMPTDAESGLASATLQQVFHGSDCSSPGTPTDVQSVTASGVVPDVILTQGFGCYTFQLLAVDNVGNDVTFTSLSQYQLTGGTSLEIVELTSGASSHFALGNLYLNTAAAADGTFRIKVLDSVAPDVASVDFPSLAATGLSGDALSDSTASFESDVYTWTNAFTSTGVITVTLHMTDSTTRTEQIQPVVDTTAPATSDDTGAIGNDWKSSAQAVTLSPADGGSGVSAVYYTIDGSAPTTSSSSGTAATLNASGVYTIRYFAVDNVGNAAAVQTASTQIRVDLDDPANSFAATAVTPAGTVFVAGTDVWFKGGTAGSFALEDTITDAHSGAASATFPALAQAEWTKSAETVTTTPYASSLFTRTASAGGSFAYAVTSADAAGNGTSTTLTFREDSTAPTTGNDWAAIGSDWKNSAQTVTLTPDDGAGSGVGATYFSLDGGASWTQGTSVVLSTSGTYLITFYSVDNVGNAEAQQTVGPINIDTTAPANSVALFGTSPSGSAYLSGGTLFYRGAAPGSMQLRTTLTDGDSGPDGTVFGAVSATNWTPKGAETVSTPAGGPYESSAFSWIAGTADFALTVTGEDSAGNTAETVLTVSDDSTPPTVSDDTASITNAWRNTSVTVTLSTSDSSGSGVAAVYHRVNGGAWTPGTSIPLTGTGVYTLEYYAVDKVGNVSAVQTAAAQIRIDKTDPSGAVTDPASGATLSGTAAQLSANASDATSGVASVQFQVRADGSMGAFSNAGLPVTMPPYDGTWDTTTVTSGDYELRAIVTDLAGNTFATGSRTITVSNVPASGPATTVIPAGAMTDTSLPVPGTTNTVTVPGGSNTATWVIETEARNDLENNPPAGSSFGGEVVEVLACVAGAGVSTSSVGACLATGGTPLTDLPLAWTVSLVGTGFPARSSDGSGWSELTSEGYVATGGGYDLSVRRVGFFTLLLPQEGAIGVSRPALVGVVQYGLLKLRWTPSGGVSPVKAYELFVDGKSTRLLGEQQTEEILGPFSRADTRVFALRAIDVHGRVSPLSNAVTAIPSLVGLTVAEARVALAGRGFAAMLGDPSSGEGDTVVRHSPSAPGLATVGSTVTLVTSGGEGHAALRLQVSNSLRIVLGLHTLNIRVALTAPAMVSAKLVSRERFVRANTGRLVRWVASYEPRPAEAGATIVSFRLPRTLMRPGAYVLVVTARSLTDGSVTQSRTPITVARPAAQRIVVGQRRVDVPLTLRQPSVVTVQLAGKHRPWRKTWPGRRVASGATELSLPLPRSLRKPGPYRLLITVRAIATGKVTRRRLPVTVVREISPETKPVDVVVLTGKDVTPSTPLKPDEGVNISQADDPEQVFATTSTPSANVQVVVIDVGDADDVELIRQLRLVYPDVKIIAVVPQRLAPAAREAGATITAVKPASAELISSLINELATGGNGSGR